MCHFSLVKLNSRRPCQGPMNNQNKLYHVICSFLYFVLLTDRAEGYCVSQKKTAYSGELTFSYPRNTFKSYYDITIKRQQGAASLQALRRMVDSNSHVWTPYCSTVTIQKCVTCSHKLGQSTGCFSLPLNQQTHAVEHTPSTSDTTEKYLIGHADATHTYLETNTIGTENSKADNTTALDTSHNTVSIDTSIHTQHAGISNIGNTLSSDCSYKNPSMDITNTDLSIPNIDSDINMTENMAEPSVCSEPHFITPLVPMASSTPRTIKAQQRTDSSTSPMIKHITTFNHSLSLPVDEPLSKDEETLNTHLVRRKLYADPHKNTIKCKTKGPPILLQKVVAPRKHTSQVKIPTKKKRARTIEKIRTSVAGTLKDAEDIQLAVELNRVPTIRRDGIYKRAGLKQKIKLTGEQTLAMKEELGMSWWQGRNHGKLFKKNTCSITK
ncbi:nrag8 protein [Plakobranchus ocellatus]|uniref:Nrag8 protein n=1 Tax=Plakobranchus ocellatus TaxID=259542 RepID=A0AAV4CEG3_9GAST|nr:nrag8 protein [Plakobranchus ocellatus]